jgi:membrane protease YdiL (CAAX protease family)
MITTAKEVARPMGRSLSAGGRVLSLVEFLIGAAIVIGHNVFHVVPNEVPILFVLALISIRLRECSWSAIGLSGPKSWLLTIFIAFIAAIAVIAIGEFVTEPLAHTLGLHTAKSAAATAASIGLKHGDYLSLAKTLALIWTFAAFGEEISYRRYLLGRAADVLDGSSLAYWIGLLVASVLFGFGHYYQGPAGVFTTGCDGLMIGAVYLLCRRNLWVAVLTHGLVDTIGLILVFFGVAD